MRDEPERMGFRNRQCVVFVVLLAGCPAGGGSDTTAMCNFDAVLDDLAGSGRAPPVDCGFVKLSDSLSSWQAAQTCALEALDAGEALEVRWQPTSVDSESYAGLVSVDAGDVSISWISYDNYQGDETLNYYACDAVNVYVDCEVSVGQMCLMCVDPGEDHPSECRQ